MEEVMKILDFQKEEDGRNMMLPHSIMDNTESQHGYHLKDLFHFCKLIGDTTSMIILSK